MTPAWMLSTALVTLLLVASAFVLARVVALYRGIPLRWVWTLAILASVAVALVWLAPVPPRSGVRARATILGPDTARMTRLPAEGAIASASTRTPMPVAAPPHARWLGISPLRMPTIAVSPALGAAMHTAWIVMSISLALLLAVASLRLRRERSRWGAHDVAGVPVLISVDFGPALVGVVRPRIVLPQWVLTLDDSARRAIVIHESEHREAHDPALMLVGLIAVVAMPWNPGLWLSLRGLRRAIELDCDERVVRHGIEGGEYARVLLHAWKTARGSWLASTAFAERASGLGVRVEHLMRPEPRSRAMRTVLGTGIAAAFVVVASVTPTPQFAQSPAVTRPYPLVLIDGVRRPDLPPLLRFTGPVKIDTLTTPTYRIVYRGPQRVDTAARKLYPSMEDGTMMQTIDAPASVAHFGPAARYGAVLYYTRKYREAGGSIIASGEGNMTVRKADPSMPASEMTGIIYRNLFNGITLAADREAQARSIIEASNARQNSLKGPGLAIWPLRVATVTERDAQLRALLTTNADRARFDQRSNESRPRGGPSIEDVVNSEYGNLFGYPNEEPSQYRVVLATDKRESARAIIRTHINDELALYSRSPGGWTDSYDQRVAMRTKRDADLRALVTGDGELGKFDRLATRLRELALKKP